MMLAIAIRELRLQGRLAISRLERNEPREIPRIPGVASFRTSLKLSPIQGSAVFSGLESVLIAALDDGDLRPLRTHH
jgi:hypothetical protein